MNYRKNWVCLFLVLLSSCMDLETVRPKTARDFYEKGLDETNNKNYSESIQLFEKCISTADPVVEEYYYSMCYYQIAFSNSLMGNKTEALKNIEILLSQVISSKEPRILAENLRKKIIANKSYQNASF